MPHQDCIAVASLIREEFNASTFPSDFAGVPAVRLVFPGRRSAVSANAKARELSAKTAAEVSQVQQSGATLLWEFTVYSTD